jgi:hypothetical protein
VEAQLGFVHDDRGRRIRLQKERGEADKAEGAVGELMGAEHVFFSVLSPLEANLVLVVRVGAEDEVAELRKDALDGAADQRICIRSLLLQSIKDGSKVSGVGLQLPINADVCRSLRWGTRSSILEMVYPKPPVQDPYIEPDFPYFTRICVKERLSMSLTDQSIDFTLRFVGREDTFLLKYETAVFGGGELKLVPVGRQIKNPDER